MSPRASLGIPDVSYATERCLLINKTRNFESGRGDKSRQPELKKRAVRR